MTATYDPNLEEKKDQVRFAIGDTKEPFFFQDEEINAVLAMTDPAYPPGDPEEGNVAEASLLCALSGMARSKGSASSRSIGPMSISDDSYARWENTYNMLVKAGSRKAGVAAVPVAFGYQISRPEFANARPTHARIGIHDYVADASTEYEERFA